MISSYTLTERTGERENRLTSSPRLSQSVSIIINFLLYAITHKREKVWVTRFRWHELRSSGTPDGSESCFRHSPLYIYVCVYLIYSQKGRNTLNFKRATLFLLFHKVTVLSWAVSPFWNAFVTRGRRKKQKGRRPFGLIKNKRPEMVTVRIVSFKQNHHMGGFFFVENRGESSFSHVFFFSFCNNNTEAMK